MGIEMRGGKPKVETVDGVEVAGDEEVYFWW